MDFDYQYDMSGWDQPQDQSFDDAYQSGDQSFDWGSMFGGGQGGFDMGGYDFGGYDFGANAPQAAPASDLESLEGGSWQFPQPMQTAYEQPSGWAQDSWNQQPLGQMAQAPAQAPGGAGGSGKEEESWWSKLLKGGIGMGVGAGTSLLGNAVQGMMTPKAKSSSPAASAGPTAGAVPSALPTAPTQPTYQPEALEPLPGTKASPLISGRPTAVKGSAGLKERNPNYGGFSLY